MAGDIEDWIEDKRSDGVEDKVIKDVLKSQGYSESEAERLLNDSQSRDKEFTPVDKDSNLKLNAQKFKKILELDSRNYLAVIPISLLILGILTFHGSLAATESSCNFEFAISDIASENGETVIEISNNSPNDLDASNLNIAFTRGLEHGTLSYIDRTNTSSLESGSSLEVRIDDEIDIREYRMALKPRSSCHFIESYQLEEEFEKRDFNLS